MILVIAEKPSVAQTIAAALGAKKKQDGYIEGDKYLISWCVGHLVQLADAAAYKKRCTVCGTFFVSKSNSVKYCPDCRKRITNRQAAERMRKRRALVTR